MHSNDHLKCCGRLVGLPLLPGLSSSGEGCAWQEVQQRHGMRRTAAKEEEGRGPPSAVVVGRYPLGQTSAAIEPIAMVTADAW